MEETNSARTTGTEDCMNDGGSEIPGSCPEAGSVDGGVPDWKEIMDALGTEDLGIYDDDEGAVPLSTLVTGSVTRMQDLVNDIMEALGDPVTNMIGVCSKDIDISGMRDLFETIERRVKRDDLFGMIVKEWITGKSDQRGIQQEIAHQLGFSCQEQGKRMPRWSFFTRKKKEVISEKAKQLSDKIRAQPKILFIFHGLTSTLDLAELGIPLDGDHIGCKLILTSDIEDILSKMNVQHTFEMSSYCEPEIASQEAST